MTGLKRIFVLFSIFIISAIKLFALENFFDDYLALQITPQFEIANGTIKEYVFDPACKNTDNKLSELDWNLKTIALFNLHVNFDVIKYVNLGLSGSFAVPQRSDFMQDYDWLNSVGGADGLHTDWLNDDPTEKTNFSEHINHLDKYMVFQAYLGGNIYLPLEFKLSPRITYQYEFIRFSSSNGYSKYKSNNFQIKKFEGKVISYEQEINSVLLGLNARVGIIPRTKIDLSFDISPNLTFLNAIDYHYINQTKYGTAFLDSFHNIMMIMSEANAQYSFSKNHSIGVNYKLQFIPGSQGKTSTKTIDKNGKFLTDNWISLQSGGGGTERFIWSLGLNYSFSL